LENISLSDPAYNLYLVGNANICEKVADAFNSWCSQVNIRISGFLVVGPGNNCTRYQAIKHSDLGRLLNIENSRFIQLGQKYYDIPEARLLSLIHPTIIISERVIFGKSTVVMPMCLFYPNVVIGDYNLIMNFVKTGHDVVIQDSCFLDYYAFAGSFCNIHSGARLGIKTTVKEYLTIGKNSRLLSVSALVKSIERNETWSGIPAKKIKT
jgi:UDP-3-O-[3-hydroxymyristoyl] glucosamine N-acyltransferase